MPQNQSSNKLSSFIGIILLIGVIGFTVFINFFVEEPIEEIEEFTEEDIYVKEISKEDMTDSFLIVYKFVS